MAGPAGAALSLAREQLALLQAGEVDAFLAGNSACFDACRAALVDPAATPEAEGAIAELAAITRAISDRLSVLMDETTERTQALARRRQAAAAYLSPQAGDAYRTHEL